MKTARGPVLLILDQDAAPEWVAPLAGISRRSEVVILTPHLVFDDERSAWQRWANGPLRFHTYAELVSDSEAAGFDVSADAVAAPHAGRSTYVGEWQRTMTSEKNAAVAKRLLATLQPARIFVQSGMGIDAQVWQKFGARRLPPSPGKLLRKLRWQARQFRKPSTPAVSALALGGWRYWFWGRLSRIAFATPQPQPVTTAATPRDLISHLRQRGEYPALLMGLHDYRAELHAGDLPIQVIADGYHPPNYPKSYLGSFGPCTVICRDRFDLQWFSGHGIATAPPLPFLESAAMRPNFRPPRMPASILLALNHAGDWTGLVNRSDTDLLVQAFCFSAGRFRDHQFVVRAHPTMAEPRHEGLNSLRRLERHVKRCGLKNLAWSEGSLNEDLDRADLVVSEYSNVLLTAWRSGIPALPVNLTGRRSFTEAFERLGFPAAASVPELDRHLAVFLSHPDDFLALLRAAAARYNTEQVLAVPEPGPRQ